ncbi:MAG: DMT family transporter [Thiohalomonadales bacterium]
MRLLIAFVSVVVIWSTTPLAIKWSSDGVSFIFSVATRMTLGAMLCLLILTIGERKLPLHREAIVTYIVAGLGIYGAMSCVYWGSQYISSGLVAVVFGLTPIVTAVMAHQWLGENSVTPGKIFAVLLGLMGISIIFKSNLSVGGQTYYGIVAMLVAVLIHAGSGIWIKRVGVSLSALELTSGALLFVSPAFILTWYLLDGEIPVNISFKAVVAISYLGFIGSVIGFTLYYYILKNMAISKVALITLVTPILALLLGQQVNSEYIPNDVWYGTTFIIIALLFHQWGDRLLVRFNPN